MTRMLGITADTDVSILTEDTSPDRANDCTLIYDASAGAHKKTLIKNMGPITCELANKTVNFNSSMTAAEIQAAIDACGKYIGPGAMLTFQFADGTYTLDATLNWTAFLGAGQITIQGNRTEANADDLHTTQAVYLDHGAVNGVAVNITLCALYVLVYNLKVRTKTNLAYTDECIAVNNCQNTQVRYSYCLGTSTAQGYGIYIGNTPCCHVQENYVSNVSRGIVAQNSNVTSYVNDDTGTAPLYGLVARYTGTIGKSGTQPAGSTANELVEIGGVIRA